MLKQQITQLSSEISSYKFTNDENIQFDEQGDVRVATLEKLIDSLFLHSKDNDMHQKTFLDTHRCFTTTHDVLMHLMAAYKIFANSSNALGYRLR